MKRKEIGEEKFDNFDIGFLLFSQLHLADHLRKPTESCDLKDLEKVQKLMDVKLLPWNSRDQIDDKHAF